MSSPILFVANSSWNLEHFRGPLITALRAAGHRVVAAVPNGQDAVAGLDTWHFPLKPEGTAPLAELRTVLALLRIFREARPAAVLSFTPKGNIYAGLAARALNIPLLPNISGLGTGFIRGGMLQRIQSALYREALRPSPTVFFQNEDDSALFQQLGLVRSEQVAMLPGSGVDCRRFRPSPLPSREPGAAKLLFVGRLLGDKGVRELAEAMRLLRPRYPALELTLVGGLGAANRTAISAAEVRGWEEEGLLRHVGATEDVRPFIAAADALVLPSYREGMPRALLEGAAMGRPLLASDVPGCRQLVEDGVNGLLFESRSPQSLAKAIERLVEVGPERRQSWGDSARSMATSRYDEKLVIEAYLSRVIALTGKAG
ncbi:glycosyltransferase family 4 protein [Sphingomonas swuensis]|uniref:glycosyltransferase family 4 protein n=1 Tax=Sphingomonas swuensis TaxID=977800 RepID=UPI0031E35660